MFYVLLLDIWSWACIQGDLFSWCCCSETKLNVTLRNLSEVFYWLCKLLCIIEQIYLYNDILYLTRLQRWNATKCIRFCV